MLFLIFHPRFKRNLSFWQTLVLCGIHPTCKKMESNKTKTSAAPFDCMGCPDSCGGFRKGILLKDSEGLDMQVLVPFLF